MFSKKKQNKGFTLIELLMVITLIGILTMIVVPVTTDYQARNDLDVAQTTFVQGIRRAQQLATASDGDSQWGVSAVPGNIVVFKGATYAVRDTNFDENYDVSGAITITGQAEYDFAKLTGAPAQTGTVTFSHGNYQKTVGVNGEGVVNY